MRKHVFMLRRPDGVARDAFGAKLLEAARRLGLIEPVIDLAAPPDATAGVPVAGAAVADAMVSWQAGAGEVLHNTAHALAAGGKIVGGYAVDECVHWDHAPGTRYAFTMVACSCRIPGITPAQFVERYRAHAGVARVHHPTIRRYVQWFVTATLEGSRPCEAIALLHFNSAEDHALHLYRDEQSRKIVDDDVARFLDRTRVSVFFATDRIAGTSPQ